MQEKIEEYEQRSKPQRAHFVVDGDPKPLARPLIGHGRGSGCTSGRFWVRDNPVNVPNRNHIRQSAMNQVPQVVFRKPTPVVVDKSHFVGNCRDNGKLKPSAPTWPSKPDLDNMDKLLLDSLTGTLYDDDCQVVKQTVENCYHNEAPFLGKTEVRIRIAEAD